MNKETGFLKVETLKAQMAMPVSGAKVTVIKKVGDKKEAVAELTTNQDGSTKPIELETVNCELSLAPNDSQPYASYDVKVEHPGYQTKYFVNVPVFPDIVSIQSVEMMPLTKGENPNDEEYIIEQEPQDL